MTCYDPRPAYIIPGVGLTFREPKQAGSRRIMASCGQCRGCRKAAIMDWSTRIHCERQTHEDCEFLTLTYAPEDRPAFGGLVKRDAQLFLKRFRKWLSKNAPGVRIRYVCGAEYGDGDTKHPHFHFIIFGFAFPDKVLWSVRGQHNVFKSKLLKELWPFGLHEIGTVTAQSGGYTVKYIMKKIGGGLSADHYQRLDPETGEVDFVEREFCLVSRRPGIGRPWFERYGASDLHGDFLTVDGLKRPVPSYFQGLMAGRFVSAGSRPETAAHCPLPATVDELRDPAFSRPVIDDAQLLKERGAERALSPQVVLNSTTERLAVRDEISRLASERYETARISRADLD